jgi:hypothetical protein
MLRDLQMSENLDDGLSHLADAIECFGWIGGARCTIYARLLADGFVEIDQRLAALAPEEPEAVLDERLTLWGIAERAGLLHRRVLGSKQDPLDEILYETATSTVNQYLRLALAWVLYGRKPRGRELSLFFTALRDVGLYHLENHYRRRHDVPRQSGGVVLAEAERQTHVAKTLECCTAKWLGYPGLARDLRSLHALLRSGVPIIAPPTMPPPARKKLDLQALMRGPSRSR